MNFRHSYHENLHLIDGLKSTAGYTKRSATMHEVEATLLESVGSKEAPNVPAKLPAWLKLGAIAAVSAVAGGLAAAWYYRQTLESFRQADCNSAGMDAGIQDDAADSDT